METNPSNFKRFRLLVLVVVLLIASSFLWVLWSNKQADIKELIGLSSRPQIKDLQIRKQEVPSTALPQGFPEDFPVEAGAKILQNYEADDSHGYFQSTRVFESGKSLNDNKIIYKAYLENNDWLISSELDQEHFRLLTATKGQDQIQVTIAQNLLTQDVSINATLTRYAN